jgi:hypothetical protein
MGRTLLLQNRELLSSNNSLGYVDIFSGGLEPKVCLPDYAIRRSPRFGGILLLIMGLGGRSKLGGIILYLLFTFGVRIYTVPLLCNLFYTGLCLSCA